MRPPTTSRPAGVRRRFAAARVARRASLVTLLATLLTCTVLASGCSLLLGFDDECRSDEECASRGAGLRCVDRLCVQAEPGGDGATGSDADAAGPPADTADVPGRDVVADSAADVRPDGPADDVPGPADTPDGADASDVPPDPDVPPQDVPDGGGADGGGEDAGRPDTLDGGPDVPSPLTPEDLLVAPCDRFYGYGVPTDQPLGDDVILIGAILPFTGQLGILGPFLDQAIEMAVKEINQVGGLRGKRFAVLSCDSGTDGAISLQAAAHLVEKARVPVIIGPVSSELTINVYNRVTGPAGVLLVSPAATSPIMDGIDTGGLVWRTSPSNRLLSAAIAEHVRSLGVERVAAVNRDDTWGNAMREVFEGAYCATEDCSGAHYRPFAYTTANFEVSQSEVLSNLVAFDPDVVVLIAYIEDGAAFLRGATAAGISTLVTPDGLRDSIAFALVPPAQHADVLCRLLGVSAEPPSSAFRIRYEAAWGMPPTPYTANAYDATYAVAYAIAAATTEDGPPPTGQGIAAAIPRLTEGTPIPTGNADWNRGVQILRSTPTATIDYQGASGEVDFDPATGGVAADVEGWHFSLTTLEPESLGIVYTWEGVYTPPNYELASEDPTCEAVLNPPAR